MTDSAERISACVAACEGIDTEILLDKTMQLAAVKLEFDVLTAKGPGQNAIFDAMDALGTNLTIVGQT